MRNSNNNKLANLNNVLKQSLTFALNSTLSVKLFCFCVLIGYFLSFKTTSLPYLTVIPGKLLPPNFFLWTLVTHSFIEVRLIELIADWFVIILYSKMLEPLWGPLECIKFYFIITFLVAISTSFFYYFAFAITFKENLLFNISIHGLGGLLGGFSVAIKQIMPDTVILNASFIRIRQDLLPLLLILFAAFLYLIGFTDLTYLVMLTFGTLIGWIYLRFFQVHKNGTRGDSSSTFVFASFFPSQIQPFVAIISNTIFNLLVRIKLCKKPPKRYNVSSSNTIGGSQSHVTITLPLVNAGIENSDAERRRQKALKALKERLKKPDDDDVTTQWAMERTTQEQQAQQQPLLASSEPLSESNSSTQLLIETKQEQDTPESSGTL